LHINFCSDYVNHSDDYATFITNIDTMPLQVLIGITNTNLLSPTVFAYIHSVSTATSNQILTSLDEGTVSSHAPQPDVILYDKSGGIMASSPKCWPVVMYQICEWHKAESLPKHLINTARYDSKNSSERKVISDAIWKYIQLNTPNELDNSCSSLQAQLISDSDTSYFHQWVYSRQEMFIITFSEQIRNLGCNSTSCDKGYHFNILNFLGPQLHHDQAAFCLANRVRTMIQQGLEHEAPSRLDDGIILFD